jgi:hypothetical protein
MATFAVVTEDVPTNGSCTVNVVTGIAIADVVAMYPGADTCSEYVPDASVTPNTNAPVASVVVVSTLAEESTSTTAADPIPFVVPACTTCPVSPNVVAVVEDDVDDGVMPMEWLHAATAHVTTRHKETL